MKKLEEKILRSFRKHMNKEIEGLNLIVCLNEPWGENLEYDCEIIEEQEDGRTWYVQCTKLGNVVSIIEL